MCLFSWLVDSCFWQLEINLEIKYQVNKVFRSVRFNGTYT